MDLQALPGEVVNNICSFLPPSAIASLRLTSSLFNGIASPYLIDTVYVDFLQESIDRLSETASHPIFRTTIRTVCYFPLTFPKIHVDYLRTWQVDCKAVIDDSFTIWQLQERLGGRQDPEAFAIDHHVQNYFAQHQAQERLLERLDMRALVSTSLSFPQLDAVIVSAAVGQPVLSSLMRAVRWSLTAELLRAVFSARETRFNHIRRFVFQDEQDTREAMLSMQYAPAWEHMTVAGLSGCLNLERLELVYRSGHHNYRAMLPFMRLASSRLRGLLLEGFRLDEDRWVEFVSGRQPTLSYITLRKCTVEPGSWSSIHQRLNGYFPRSREGTDEEARWIAFHT
ncbi:MAG: hypothetical protein M1816_006560 [Peltula sp. TS41687]|nr:MAG: hypothetical protein M1816_006560 [Peltula sp. TS41687]